MGNIPLGVDTPYPETYAPELLAPIARAQSRASLGLLDSALPFTGADVWNAFELSWLGMNGQPQAGRGRFIFPCTSPNIIESKSLKLYLNSLNQHRFVDLDQVIATIGSDLSAAAGERVQVLIQPFSGMQEVLDVPDGICLDALDVSCNEYHLNSELLHLADEAAAFEAIVDEVLFTDTFRSRCPITQQPDWATVVICYQGPAIDHAALLQYLVSFRLHNDFHEHCAEQIYTDIMSRCRPQSLIVEANFIRRGGLDINPVRSSSDAVNYIALPRYSRQ